MPIGYSRCDTENIKLGYAFVELWTIFFNQSFNAILHVFAISITYNTPALSNFSGFSLLFTMEAPEKSVINVPKKSPLVVRMVVVLMVVMVCGAYNCSIRLKQMSPHTTASRLLSILVAAQQGTEMPYLHYPKPETVDREECACNPVRYFAIMSQQRSGSGWFETLLNSHINVSSNGEIFGTRERRTNISAVVKTLDKVYNLDWFSSASKNQCTAAVGFKWMLNQGLLTHREGIAEYFKERGAFAIFLFRRNLLRRMVSKLANSHDSDAKLLNGIHKSHVYSAADAQVLANYKPKVNTTSLVSHFRKLEVTAAKVVESFKSTRHIVLYYEDLVNNRTKLKEVQEFLRLPYRELTSTQVKIHNGPLSQQIQNWEEVQNTLKGTPFERFLQ
ncbi:hypothetical protein HS088_TW06G01165 [Tripterygium wilfordii]|uniref:Sulfotransferase n=1 Tax=Tripterygium wilfordii TaxID=458696 RepID=A0A7J7DL03_TRIWF|nr:nodulation protein H-like isoform X2 [Tripterygium wilfordii]KAF5746988.1 hypothetical protein HS088_TW06G01165 [Tripterygium wilfordii]